MSVEEVKNLKCDEDYEKFKMLRKRKSRKMDDALTQSSKSNEIPSKESISKIEEICYLRNLKIKQKNSQKLESISLENVITN